MMPPTVNGTFDDLPATPGDRHEAFVSFFGQHLFSIRNQRIAAIRRCIESAEVRERLGNYHRRHYEAISSLSPEGQDAAVALAQYSIDLFMQDLLSLFQNTGPGVRLGTDHAFKYQLVLEIMDLGDDEEPVVAEELVNHGGARALGDYFGRWLNAYSYQA
jgi:hypothetical protein